MDRFTNQTIVYIAALLLLVAVELFITRVSFLLYVAVHLVYIKFLHSDLRRQGYTRLWLLAVLVFGVIAALAYLLHRSPETA